ncbi:MAG: insulinase family protein [Clostridia bacterium]|nr:insulinase family protein [Clostridia bacterium]
MADRKIDLKEGIKAHLIKTDIFKTNLVSIILTTPLRKKNITKNALIPFLLKMGSKNFNTQEKISLRLEELYGTSLNCGVDKVGDNQIIKFVAESIDNHYTLNGEDLIKDVIDLLVDVTFNPYLENGKFKESAIGTEKEHLKDIIEGRINNKDEYAYTRCLENMYEFDGYGLYRFGYLEDLEKITLEEISSYYFELIKNAKIDIYLSGNFEEGHVEKILRENPILQGLTEREPEYIVTNPSTDYVKKVDNPKEIQEKMEIKQGKLVIGYNIFDKQQNSRNIGIVFNSILGDSATSMLFQNVREKAGLAYTARSRIY